MRYLYSYTYFDFLKTCYLTYITCLLGLRYMKIFPSVSGKPWSVTCMYPKASAFDIGQHNKCQTAHMQTTSLTNKNLKQRFLVYTLTHLQSTVQIKI